MTKLCPCFLLQATRIFLIGLLVASCDALMHENQHDCISRRTTFAQISGAVSSVLIVNKDALAEPPPASIFPPPGAGSPAMPEKKLYSESNGSWTPSPPKTTLGSRLSSTQLNPLQQPMFGSQELYFAPFLFGSWDVDATLQRKIFPFGPGYVPSRALAEAMPECVYEKMGSSAKYELRYFTTLANTAANQLTVNLGLGIPKTQIIGDRAFNTASTNTAYNQLSHVDNINWDYRDDPTRLILYYSSISGDMRPLGKKRQEVYISARATETFESSPDIFCCAERSRHVTLGQGSASTVDLERITEYRQVGEDTVQATQRLAIYLTPNPNSREGILWQQVGGKAVAIYDFELEMKRKRTAFTLSDGSTVMRPCVNTPNDIIQCE